MERVNLKQAFHGEPDHADQGLGVEATGYDEVTVGVRRGTFTLRVPSNVPDSRVISREFLDQFMQLVVQLEDGSELTIILGEDRDGVDVRLITPREMANELKTESRLEAERSPRAEPPEGIV